MGAEILPGWALLPDALVRRKIRELFRRHLDEVRADDAEDALAREERLVAEMRESAVVLATDDARERSEEVPPSFFLLALGAHRKDSPGLWSAGITTLDEAEAAMLALTCERAGIADGQNVLELGCGWGSLTLWIAERHPASRVVAVTRSADQREYVEARAAERNLTNVKVVTADMGSFDPATGPAFDRVVSVGTFGRMGSWPELLGRIASWLKPDGRLFVELISHRDVSHVFAATDGTGGWEPGLFPGGLIPSDHLLLRFPEHLFVEARWRVNGTHYARTAEAWLANLDRNRRDAKRLFAKAAGTGVARRKVAGWRLSLVARAELGAFRGGSEWMVSQYRLRRRHT